MDQAMIVAELRARVDVNTEAIEKLDDRVTRHDEIIADLREAVAKVATKDDIAELRKDIGEKFDVQLRDAHNSIPGKIGLLLTGASVVIALVALLISRHG